MGNFVFPVFLPAIFTRNFQNVPGEVEALKENVGYFRKRLGVRNGAEHWKSDANEVAQIVARRGVANGDLPRQKYQSVIIDGTSCPRHGNRLTLSIASSSTRQALQN